MGIALTNDWWLSIITSGSMFGNTLWYGCVSNTEMPNNDTLQEGKWCYTIHIQFGGTLFSDNNPNLEATCTYTDTYPYTIIYIYVYMYMFIYTLYICIYVCICVCICVCIYIYTRFNHLQLNRLNSKFLDCFGLNLDQWWLNRDSTGRILARRTSRTWARVNQCNLVARYTPWWSMENMIIQNGGSTNTTILVQPCSTPPNIKEFTRPIQKYHSNVGPEWCKLVHPTQS